MISNFPPGDPFQGKSPESPRLDFLNHAFSATFFGRKSQTQWWYHCLGRQPSLSKSTSCALIRNSHDETHRVNYRIPAPPRLWLLHDSPLVALTRSWSTTAVSIFRYRLCDREKCDAPANYCDSSLLQNDRVSGADTRAPANPSTNRRSSWWQWAFLHFSRVLWLLRWSFVAFHEPNWSAWTQLALIFQHRIYSFAHHHPSRCCSVSNFSDSRFSWLTLLVTSVRMVSLKSWRKWNLKKWLNDEANLRRRLPDSVTCNDAQTSRAQVDSSFGPASAWKWLWGGGSESGICEVALCVCAHWWHEANSDEICLMRWFSQRRSALSVSR